MTGNRLSTQKQSLYRQRGNSWLILKVFSYSGSFVQIFNDSGLMFCGHIHKAALSCHQELVRWIYKVTGCQAVSNNQTDRHPTLKWPHAPYKCVLYSSLLYEHTAQVENCPLWCNISNKCIVGCCAQFLRVSTSHWCIWVRRSHRPVLPQIVCWGRCCLRLMSESHTSSFKTNTTRACRPTRNESITLTSTARIHFLLALGSFVYFSRLGFSINCLCQPVQGSVL